MFLSCRKTSLSFYTFSLSCYQVSFTYLYPRHVVSWQLFLSCSFPSFPIVFLLWLLVCSSCSITELFLRQVTFSVVMARYIMMKKCTFLFLSICLICYYLRYDLVSLVHFVFRRQAFLPCQSKLLSLGNVALLTASSHASWCTRWTTISWTRHWSTSWHAPWWHASTWCTRCLCHLITTSSGGKALDEVALKIPYCMQNWRAASIPRFRLLLK